MLRKIVRWLCPKPCGMWWNIQDERCVCGTPWRRGIKVIQFIPEEDKGGDPKPVHNPRGS